MSLQFDIRSSLITLKKRGETKPGWSRFPQSSAANFLSQPPPHLAQGHWTPGGLAAFYRGTYEVATEAGCEVACFCEQRQNPNRYHRRAECSFTDQRNFACNFLRACFGRSSQAAAGIPRRMGRDGGKY